MTHTIGGSECAAAAGVHPFTSPVMLWSEKTGRVARPETEAMEWGRLLEPVVVARLREAGWTIQEGVTVEGSLEREMLPAWFVAHVDGLAAVDGVLGVLEVKTANAWAHASWRSDVPVQYAAQCQWYMHATGLDRTLLAVLVAGQRLELRTVLRDDRAIELLLEAAERFHWHLVTDTPPPPDGSKSTREALGLLFPDVERGARVRLIGDDWTALRELRELRVQAKAIDEQIARRENTIKAAMGSAETAISPYDDEVAHWRLTTTRRVDTTALRKARPDVAQEFTTETHTRRFTVV